LNSKPHETQLKDQKIKKSLKRSFRRSKTAMPTKRHEKRQTMKNGKEEARKA
jgi:hypothetical protein